MCCVVVALFFSSRKMLRRYRVTCRLIALDHQQSDIYLVTIEDTSETDSKKEAAEWRQKRMRDIQKALSACEPQHLLCNGSAATVPAANSNGTHSTAHARIAQQQSRPVTETNGCSHAVSANGEVMRLALYIYPRKMSGEAVLLCCGALSI